MKFEDALKTLGIEKYKNRIFNSNSHGELSHLADYILLADVIGKTEWFPKWFEKTVEYAEKNWQRQESVFQHVFKILFESLTK